MEHSSAKPGRSWVWWAAVATLVLILAMSTLIGHTCWRESRAIQRIESLGIVKTRSVWPAWIEREFFDGNPISDVAYVAYEAHLEEQVSDTDLAVIAGAHQLEYLNLEGTAITDAGIRELASCRNWPHCISTTSASVMPRSSRLQSCGG